MLASGDADGSAELFKALLESNPDCLQVFDLEGRFVLMNAHGLEAMEIEDFSLVEGRPWWDAWPRESRERVRKAIAVAREGRHDRFQGFCPTLSNRRKWWDVIVAPVRDDAGKVVRVLAISRDITRAHEAERASRESQRRLRLVFDNIPAAVSYVDGQRFYRFSNARYEDWLGTDPDGRHMREVLGEDIYRHRKPYIDRVLKGESLCFEGPLVCRGMELRQGEIHYVPETADSGNVVGFYIMVFDITGRKKAELAHRESEARFRLLADAAPVMIWLSDERKQGVYFNQGWLDFTGRALEEELGDGWLAAIHPDDLVFAATTCQRAFEEAEPFRMEFRMRRADGVYRWVLDHGVPRFNEQGALAGYIGSCIDMSDLKEVEEKLRDADRRKDEFLATLAHELRNPLAPIRTALELLKRAGGEAGMVEEVRAILERQTQQLVTLVNDLLDLSRVTSGRLQMKKRRVELAPVIQAAVEASMPLIDGAGHRLVLSLPDSPVWLHADPNRLTQVLSNLLNNAAIYTDDGGRIGLAAEVEGGEVRLIVEDNGVGIPEDKRENIFEMFTQIKQPAEKHTAGLGIGLTLVKSVVAMHEGSVRALDREDGPGSRFIVTLPLPEKSAGDDSAQTRCESRGLPALSSRVLVVDDNQEAVDTLALLLKMHGCEVQKACDGVEALERAAQFLPDAVLMDLGMPRMDGYEAARLMRQQEWGRNMLLVAVSGWGQEEAKARSRQAGFDDHLVKPADLKVLMALLEQAGARKEKA